MNRKSLFGLRAAVAAAVALAEIVVAASAYPQSQDVGQQRCLTTLAKRGEKVALRQGKEIRHCLRAAARGKLAPGSSTQACLGADTRAKVAKSRIKTEVSETKLCNPPPDFGYTDAINVNSASTHGPLGIALKMLGWDINQTVLSGDGGHCQAALVKDFNRLMIAELKHYRSCLKKQLANGGISSRAALQLCFDSIKASGASTITSARTRLSEDLTKRCSVMGYANAFPGVCAGASEVVPCLNTQVDCSVCRILVEGSDAGVDCDAFDDGIGNDSCDTNYPQAFRNMMALPIDGQTYYVSASDPCASNSNDGLAPDCATPGSGPWVDLSPLWTSGQRILWPGDAVALRVGADYLIIEGIEIRGCNMVCMLMKEGSEHVVFRNNTVVGGGEDGIKASRSRNILIIGNEFTSFHNEAVDVWGSNNYWLVDNSFHDNDVSWREPRSAVWTKGGSANIHFSNNRFFDLDVANHALMLGGCCWQNWDDSGGLVQSGGQWRAQPVARQVYAVGNSFESISTVYSAGALNPAALAVTGCHDCQAVENSIVDCDEGVSIESTKANHQPCFAGAVCGPNNENCDCFYEVPPKNVLLSGNFVQAIRKTPENSGASRLYNVFNYGGDYVSELGISVDANSYCVDPLVSLSLGTSGIVGFPAWQAAGFDPQSALLDEADCAFPVSPFSGVSPWGIVESYRSINSGRLLNSHGQELWLIIWWQGIQPDEATMDFSVLDDLVTTLEGLGVEISFKLETGQGHWGVEPLPPGVTYGGSMPPKDLGRYYDWVYAVARRYRGRVRAYAIENEVAATSYWAASWADYVPVLARGVSRDSCS